MCLMLWQVVGYTQKNEWMSLLRHISSCVDILLLSSSFFYDSFEHWELRI